MSDSFGEYIRELRKKKRLTLVQLSNLSGVSNPYLSQIENDKFIPSPEILRKLSEPLGVNQLELLLKSGNSEESDLDKFGVRKLSHTNFLVDTYLEGALVWSEDRNFFDEKQTVAIRDHLADLLMEYKLLVEGLAYAESSWVKNKDVFLEVYGKDKNEREIKEIFLTGKLEKELKSLNEKANNVVARYTLGEEGR